MADAHALERPLRPRCREDDSAARVTLSGPRELLANAQRADRIEWSRAVIDSSHVPAVGERADRSEPCRVVARDRCGNRCYAILPLDETAEDRRICIRPRPTPGEFAGHPVCGD